MSVVRIGYMSENTARVALEVIAGKLLEQVMEGLMGVCSARKNSNLQPSG